MTTIEELSTPRPITAATSQATAVEQARAVAEVAAAVKVAQECPRDITRAIERMRQACSQKSLAERAFYSLPRAGGRVEGSTVHLAREIAGCYGNIDYGIRELRRDDAEGVSEIQAWAWDQENNVRSSRSFVVPHAIMAQKKRKHLTDLGDIANNNNSVAARAVRETIFTILPIWFRDEAEQIAAKTLQDGGGKTLAQQVADSVAHFANTHSVTVAQLEDRLDRPRNDWTAQDVAVLRLINGEMARGEKRAEDEFPGPDRPAPSRAVTADEITGKPDADPQTPEPGGPDDPWATTTEATA